MKKRVPEVIIFVYMFSLLIIGLSLQPINELYDGLYNILTSTGILITDYMVIGGVGPALVNGALVAFIGMLLIKINSVPMTGPSIACIFIMAGFGLFGKNIWSVLPIIFGVYIFSKIKKQKFKTYIYPALFGTALAPFVTYYAFTTEFGIWPGIIIGILAGIIIPPLATHLLKAHEGYNLYNVGFSAGFVGLLIYNILRGYGFSTETVLIWGTEFNEIIRKIIIPMVISMIIVGFLINKQSFKGYKEIFKYPGVLITDYIPIAGFGNTLINMGLVGLVGIAYIELVGAHYNGATLGALLTVIGFGAFGKNPKNITPIIIGVYLGTIFSHHEANGAGPIFAALFGTCLAPLAGKFGPIIGILAGFTHLSVVSYIGGLHGGLNLYNNGFAAGIVATIFVALIQGFKKED
ncbi:DUF1576 domain-containing protein [Tissierella sp. Yu-01]|uniref:DUF1576 domain-containing protein n=1 Tax=Tissierella sp. Yu-01 TaxID=3035694 RepID=UPI00240D0AC3|nr:DUF1576 domain-containing protein [Tissierella sp. Yu-01]WFA08594.1 DUF1576 domain-containing protein [Tissierella sp. Yu-01]